MDARGRVTLPAAVRKQIHLSKAAALEVTLEQGQILLRPLRIPAEDAWAYTAESLRSIGQALKDSREGRVYRLSEADLRSGRFPRRRRRRTARGHR